MSTETAAAAEQQADRRRILRRLVLFGIVSLGLALLSRQTDVRTWLSIESLRDTAQRLGWWAPLAIVVAGVCLPLALLPRWPIAFLSGLLYGVALGSLLANVASLLGAWLQFALARDTLGQASRRLPVAAKWKALLERRDRAFLVLLFLRAFPLSSFVATNILAGTLRLPLRTYLAATFLGMVPSTLIYATWGKVVQKPTTGFYVLVAAVLLFVAGGTVLAQRYLLARRSALEPVND